MPKLKLKVVQPPLPSSERSRIEGAAAAGGALAKRLRGRAGHDLRDCPVRMTFLRRAKSDSPVPPMMQMLTTGGGRGGEVRLKLYLSMLWASPAKEHDTVFEAADWARLLGLPQYSTNGKRRIYDAVEWLSHHQFIEKEERPGQPSTLTVLDESAGGDDYVVPSSDPPVGGRPSYKSLPSAWWTSGWIAAVSGRALAFWLVVNDRTTKAHPRGPVWMSESLTSDIYAMSPYMRQAGMRELAELELIGRQRKIVGESFGVKSSRTEVRLRPARLKVPPIFDSG